MRKIIFTDLDGTLTYKDTYRRFLIKHFSIKRLISNFYSLLKVFILYIFRVKNGNDVKIETFKSFFSNKNVNEVESTIEKFVTNIEWNKNVIDKIFKEKANGAKVIIVSASPDLYLESICNELGFHDYICTLVEFDSNIYTGKFIGKVCNFDEKVKRIKEYLDDEEYYKISYGNSKGDYRMLEYCEESYFVKKSKISTFLY